MFARILCQHKVFAHNSQFGWVHMQQMIGRDSELKSLEKAFDDAVGGRGNTILVSGEAGIGKTALVQEFIRCAMSSAPIFLTGRALADTVQPFQIFSKALAGVTKRAIFEEHEYRTFTELFVIDHSGLLLAQAAPEDDGLDADIFAGMFSAVQDFVRDSFDRSGGQKGTLGRLEYGEMKILVEHGQKIFLVAVFRGAENQDMRGLMKKSVHDIEKRYGHILEKWSGNIKEMAGVAGEIASLAQVRFLVRKSLEGVSLDQERTRIADEVLDILEDVSGKGTVLMLLEDLHLADESSVFVLNYLARNIRSQRILIIATLRPEEGKRALEGLGRAREESAMAEVALEGLDADSTFALIEELYPNHRFPGSFIEKFIGQCDGNPFFATEMLKELEATGSILQQDGVFLLEEHDIALPSSIDEVVHKRIEKLDRDSLALVEFASCIGREFDRNILARLKPASEAAGVLQKLTDAGIIVMAKDVDQFSHAMFQSVIYDGLSNRWKSHYHKSIGEHYEEAYRNQPDAVIYELARHFSMTSEHLKIFDYCRKAGEKAEGSYSPDLAVEYYEKAIAAIPWLKMGADAASHQAELLERLGDVCTLGSMFDKGLDALDRAASAQPDPEARARLHRKRADLFERKGEYDIALSETSKGEMLVGPDSLERWKLSYQKAWVFMRKGDFDQCVELCDTAARELGRFEGVERVLGEVFSTLGGCYYLKGDYPKSLGFYINSLELREKAGDTRGIASSNNNIGVLLSNMGKLEESLERHDKCMAAMRKMGDQSGIATAHNNKGTVFLNRGDIESALGSHMESLKIREKIGDRQGIASSCCNLGQVFRNMGDLSKALEYNRRGLRFFELTGDLWGVGGAHTVIGDCLREIGDYAKSVESYNEAIRVCKNIGSKDFHAGALLGLAEVYLDLGDLAAALPKCAEAEKIIEENVIMDRIAHSYRLRGRLFVASNECVAANAKFSAALEESEKIGSESDTARTHYEWGRMLVTSGDVARGREMLASAKEVFEKRGMKRWAEKARIALEEQ
jgi:tetratricopeptide (TPR) repeat protein